MGKNLAISQEKFLEKVRAIHGNKYDYSLTEYKSNKKPIIIICPEHGKFSQQASAHIRKMNGCPKCGRIKSAKSTLKTTENFVKDARLKHGDRYDYSKFVYMSSRTYGIIICKKHGEFEQNPSNHLTGHGCLKCGKENMMRSKSLLEHLVKARKLHSDKYDYSKVVFGPERSKGVVTIICPTHGEFKQIWRYHLRGKVGCPLCMCNSSIYSQKAIDWLVSVSKKENIFIQHAENSKEFVIPTTKYRADGYCDATKTVYEFYGDYWHGNPNRYDGEHINSVRNMTMGELYTETIRRENIIKNLGYNLITIWESDWDLNKKSLVEINKTQ